MFRTLVNGAQDPPQVLCFGHLSVDELDKEEFPDQVFTWGPYIEAPYRSWKILGIRHRWFKLLDYRYLNPIWRCRRDVPGKVTDEWPGYGLIYKATELILEEIPYWESYNHLGKNLMEVRNETKE